MLKPNKNMLAAKLRQKFTGKCVTAIVTEAFVNGLPLNQEEIANESAELGRYAARVLATMHPDTLLDQALESVAGDPYATLFLKNLKGDISAVVESAVDRTLKERSLSDQTTPEIVEQATLDSKEVQKLVNASKHNGIDAVSKVIHDKMIKTIKDEKASYEQSEALKEKIKEVIQDNPTDDHSVGAPADTQSPNQGFDGETSAPTDSETEGEGEASQAAEDNALESYLNYALDPTDAREPISFFSRLQDVCMESILHSTENWTGEIPYETLQQITLESTLPFFDLSNRTLQEELRAIQIATESVEEAMSCHEHDGMLSPEEKAHKMKKIAKTSLICTICILTLLETLKTMHLKNPTMDQVKDFIAKPTAHTDAAVSKLDNVELKVNKAANEIKKSVALGSLASVESAIAKESLNNVKDILNGLAINPMLNEQKDRIISTIDSALEAVGPTPKSRDQSAGWIARAKNDNLVAMEHALKLLTMKPMVKNIRICMESSKQTEDGLRVTLEAQGLGNDGQIVNLQTFSVAAYPEFGDTIPEVVQECAQYIQLGMKPVDMYYKDSGYAVHLN